MASNGAASPAPPGLRRRTHSAVPMSAAINWLAAQWRIEQKQRKKQREEHMKGSMEPAVPQAAVAVEEEEEELKHLPPEEKKDDPLLGVVIRKGAFEGEVEDIERGTISKELGYRVRYQDSDLEHYAREQVLHDKKNLSAADLGTLTVVELKARLREQNLPVSGRKAVLVERLRAAMVAGKYDSLMTDSKVDEAAKTKDVEHKTTKKQDESQAGKYDSLMTDSKVDKAAKTKDVEHKTTMKQDESQAGKCDSPMTDSKVDKAAKTKDVEHKTTVKQDESQASKYDSFMTGSKVDKAARTKDVEHKTTKKKDESQALTTKNDDLDGTQKEPDAALAYFDRPKPSCVDAGVTYEDRVARRKEEIEAKIKDMCVPVHAKMMPKAHVSVITNREIDFGGLIATSFCPDSDDIACGFEQDEEEELEDLPPEEKENDPLLGMIIRKGPFNGEVEEIERGTISGEIVYRVRYEDNDLEHFTREQVLQYRKNAPAADLDTMTVVELKARLREQNLPVSGRKAMLVERLGAATHAEAKRRKCGYPG